MLRSRANAPARLLLAFFATSTVACGGAQSVTRDEVVALQQRVVQLERDAGRAVVQIEEMEERIFLLQDRVEAARVNATRRHDSDYVRNVVTVGTAARPVTAPNTSAPPPFPEVDPLAVPALPVQRVAPTGAAQGPATAAPAADPFAEAWNAEPEVVITNETLAARYGSEPSVGTARSTARSAPGARVAQPPVDVGGATLPVVASPAPGRTQVAAAAPAAGAPRAAYDRALDQFNNGQYAEALQSLTSFVESAPAPDYMDNALFWMGECYYGMGRYNDALGYFQRVVSEYPDGNKVPDSLLKVALSYERLNNTAAAREVLSVVADTYPSTDAARRARERLQSIQ